MNNRFPIRAVAVLMAALAGLATAAAGAKAETASAWSQTAYTQVRLVAAVAATGSGETVPLGLHFRMEKGWKIYWRAPGDAGFPPKVKWDGSANLADAALAWPAPERFRVLGIDTIGYKDEVVLPVIARVARTGEALTLDASVDFLTCDQICVPHTTRVSLALPAGPATPSAEAHLVNRFAARVPGDGARLGLSVESAAIVPARDAKGRPAATVVVALRAREPLAKPDIFIDVLPREANGADLAGINFGEPKTVFGEGRVRASIAVPVDGATPAELAGRAVSIVVVDGARLAERSLILDAGIAAPKTAGGNGATLLSALALALLGGLILNLMPCVLPVLSLKLLGVVRHGGGERRMVRLSFIASAAGILFAFLLLAAILIALKAGGAAIGWGIQFQQSWFLIAMILVVMLFAANLWGFFEVRLPEAVADLGGHAAHAHGLGGHFLTGAFATLLATPCTAPFLGTAIGFALARGPVDILAVFAALGVGLALPYLAVAAFPALATRLPKPGLWMVRLKQVLGFALLATAIWLATVLVAQIGTGPASSVALFATALMLFLYLGHRRPRAKAAALAGMVLSVALAFAVPLGLAQAPAGITAKTVASSNGKSWRPFDERHIATLVATGKTVFVDVTADWCITCKANKAVVLNQGEVARRLAAEPVVPMQADWTRPDDRIAAYLARFGRYGIPFNAVYGPAAPDGIPLSEILTEKEVLDALAKAGTVRAALAR